MVRWSFADIDVAASVTNFTIRKLSLDACHGGALTMQVASSTLAWFLLSLLKPIVQSADSFGVY